MALGWPYPRSGRSVLSEVGCLCRYLDATLASLFRPLLVHPHPSPGLYQRRLHRGVGVLQAQVEDGVLRAGEPVAGVRLQRCQVPGHAREVAGRVPRYVLGILRSHLRRPNPLPENRRVGLGRTLAGARLSTRPARACASPSPRVGWSVCPGLPRGYSVARTPVPRAPLSGFGPVPLARSPAEPPPPPGPPRTLLCLSRSGLWLTPVLLLLDRVRLHLLLPFFLPDLLQQLSFRIGDPEHRAVNVIVIRRFFPFAPLVLGLPLELQHIVVD